VKEMGLTNKDSHYLVLLPKQAHNKKRGIAISKLSKMLSLPLIEELLKLTAHGCDQLPL